MRRLTQAWSALDGERRLAALASLGLLITMFLPWYSLQSLDRKTGAIFSHSINAFGDVSFVEAAIFLVSAGVLAMLLARADGRNFQLPGGDGTITLGAGGWAAVLIFYRVFSRPSGNGYPVGIEWGFFLAFVAAGLLALAGWRLRATEHHGPLVRRGPGARRQQRARDERVREREREGRREASPAHVEEIFEAEAATVVSPRAPRPPAPAGDERAPGRERRPSYPPAPGPSTAAARRHGRERPEAEPTSEQLSFEDPPGRLE